MYSGVAKMADLGSRFTQYLAREIEALSRSYDVVVVDTSAGISTQVVDFLRVADDVVVVTTPKPVASVRPLEPPPPSGLPVITPGVNLPISLEY